MDGSGYFISVASAVAGLVAMPQTGRGGVFVVLWYVTNIAALMVLVSAVARGVAKLLYRV